MKTHFFFFFTALISFEGVAQTTPQAVIDRFTAQFAEREVRDAIDVEVRWTDVVTGAEGRNQSLYTLRLLRPGEVGIGDAFYSQGRPGEPYLMYFRGDSSFYADREKAQLAWLPSAEGPAPYVQTFARSPLLQPERFFPTVTWNKVVPTDAEHTVSLVGIENTKRDPMTYRLTLDTLRWEVKRVTGESVYEAYDFEVIRQTYDPASIADSVARYWGRVEGYTRVKWEPQSAEDLLLPLGSQMPAIRGITPAGDSVGSWDLRGKYVLVDFWYQGCYPCLKSLPFLKELKEDLTDQNLEIIGINPYDDRDSLFMAFLERKAFNYPVILTSRKLPKRWGVRSYPTFYLFNPEGELIYRATGWQRKVAREVRREVE